ncbi:MAG: 2-(1,2-epoxy-1,2-dihydrophenyl)acetyl-CoA isomerase [Flammeovirgaceae bacterium]|nr:2-(1,2-epoxy-1,2-dihydrophenyl)acetyl-CoA isomerase [Flammeovirgaceae bacterium]MBR08585.1 2-(1,2-epoxy-1,2-dihydrophenyl)acetyl-CoA isomerase [Rickettsiales bacterium]HCX20596.1 2-(1,2-epoxy-1,2-dihydrophenyl)acetyl-CoA isomerase [Cytophagales bacterium]|tara:strand:+ start:3957 stop:4736 length:780 start_codon:yes stop_codon:yes gene_type:complete
MSAVLFDVKDNIATITLNRPEAYNSVNTALAHGLIDALQQCKDDDTIRTIVLTGSGKAFCAGQDLKEVTTPELNPGFDTLMKDHYEPIVHLLREIEKPIIAKVNGVAAGAGANFALACDIIVAVEHAVFIQAFSAIGLIPDSGGTYTLPRAVGMAKATALAMLGDKVSAEEAERIGMIYKYFSAETFEEEVQAIAKKLADMPTKGLGLTKLALNQSLKNSFDQQMLLETDLQLKAASTEDYNEGVAAFVEKRKPEFKGR